MGGGLFFFLPISNS